MKLHIILRMHDLGDVRLHEKRIKPVGKPEIVRRCTNSLFKSIRAYNGDVSLDILDDHSTKETREIVENLSSDLNPTFHEMELSGNNFSLLTAFDMMRKSTADMVYMVEDDFLHYENAITKMVRAYNRYSELTGQTVALHPFDDQDNYKPECAEPCRLTYVGDDLWRTNYYCTGTFATAPKTIAENWDVCYRLAHDYGIDPNVREDNTISLIWRNHTNLFSPIRSLAIHMGDPINVKHEGLDELWNDNKIVQ